MQRCATWAGLYNDHCFEAIILILLLLERKNRLVWFQEIEACL